MKNLIWIFLVLIYMPISAFAQSSARDADVDLKMNADVFAGIAPPTGSQALPVVPAKGPQRFIDPYLPAAMQTGSLVLGQTDGKARVYKVTGNVKRMKSGNPVERRLRKGHTIRPGDTIVTDSKSSVAITFDENYMNAVKIPENSHAVIVSIEPTEIKISNGSVYSAIDGLPQGSTWKVQTPGLVAAVRGTLYIVTFAAADGSFYSATVNVPDDGNDSSIDIHEIDGNASTNIPEGKEITLTEGQGPDAQLVVDLDPAMIQEILDFFEDLKRLRAESDNNGAPPTSGSLTGTNTLDPAGPGVVGGGNDPLDPLIDTNNLPPEFGDSFSSGSSDLPGDELPGNDLPGDGLPGDDFPGDDFPDDFPGQGGPPGCPGGGGRGHPNNDDPNPGVGCD